MLSVGDTNNTQYGKRKQSVYGQTHRVNVQLDHLEFIESVALPCCPLMIFEHLVFILVNCAQQWADQ